MKKFNNILINLGYFLVSLIIYLIIITTFSYFNLINYKTISIISFITLNILFLINGFKLGKRSDKKGYLSGIIMGLSMILLLLFLSIIFRRLPSIKSFIYFLVLLLSSTIGGMFGINKRKS